MGSSIPSARLRHTRHSKSRHHREGHGPRAHRSDHRRPEGPSPTIYDDSTHDKKGLIHSWLECLRAPKLRPVGEEGYSAESSISRKRSWAQSAHPSSDRAGRPLYYYERGKTQQVDPGASGHFGVSSPAEHHFEKKARRKTRAERYDTLKTGEVGRGKKAREKPRKQSRKKRGNLSSAREVMDNFNSNTILNDRITMQPSLRPGLFDNGRASKNQLPDLTFHEMAFVKHPRHGPPKPISRSRENEKRRSEREREEVSAFFLHDNLPECHHTARKQIASRTTYSTRSTSHNSKENGSGPTSELRRQRMRSSTPVSIREALARTGAFDNTGVHYAASCQRHDKESMSRLGGQFSNSKAPQMPAAYTAQGRQEPQSQPIRIICYQDRGTMANEDELCTGDNGGNPLAQCGPTIAQEVTLHAVDHPLHENTATASQPAQREAVSCPKDASVNAGTPYCEGENKTSPERPKSPKWDVIQRLEAAAESFEPQESQTHTTAGRVMQHPQQNNHTTAICCNHSVPSDYRSVTQGVPFAGHSPPARPSRPCLPEPGQHDHDSLAEQQRDVPQVLNLHLTPRRLQISAQSAHSSFYDVGQPAFGYSSAPSPSHDDTSGPLAQRYATMRQNSFVGSVPRSQNDMASPIATGHVQVSDSLASMERQPMPWRRDGVLLQDISRQQGMEDYIDQLEQEVLRSPQEEDDRGSPMLQRNGVQEYNVGDMDHEAESQGLHGFHQPYVEPSGQTDGLWGAATPLRSQGPSRVSLQNWANVRPIEDEEEQSLLMSILRRPNRHLM